MAINLGASVAPESLTVREVLEVTADAFIIQGLCHRAITRTGIWDRQDALYSRAESALESGFEEARGDLNMWLDDCKTDGRPRFFNNELLTSLLRDIDAHYTRLFNSADDADLPALIEELVDRNFDRLVAVTV